MVKKHSKRGLNTGNTIRRYARESALHEHRRYGCLTVCSEVGEDESHASQDAVRELTDMFPSTEHIEIEYSLNKQRRLELPEYIKFKIDEKADSTDVQVTMIERDINVPTCNCTIISRQDLKHAGRYNSYTWLSFDGSMAQKYCWAAWPTALGKHIDDRNRCKCYHSNLSAAHSGTSCAGMTAESAKQGCIAEDHMTKAERRQLKKAKTEEDSMTLPKFECCISYGPSSTGKLYLDASNNHQRARNMDFYDHRDRSYLKGPNKRRQKDALEVDYSSADDRDIDGDTEGEKIRDSPPSSASLSDFLIPSKNKPQRRKKRRSHGKQRQDTDNDDKTHIQYIISSPDNSTIECTKPMLYIPNSSHALIKSSDLSKEALISNYDDKYREAYCTPRTISLSLSADVDGEEFYMVMVVACEGKYVDWYRIYCSGRNISFELSALSTVEEGKLYELSTLVCLALEYRQIVVPARETTQDILNQSAVYYCDKKGDSNVCTSELCNVIKSALLVIQQAIEAEIEDYNENNNADYVVVPSMQCSICLEYINDSTLHTAVLPCQHDFCNQCWNRHLCTAIYQGLVHITCIQCNTQLDPVFIMSMVEFSTYRLFEFLLAYSFLSKGQVVKSCPAIGCHRLLHCDKELMEKNQPLKIRCLCSRKYCFRCLKEPHWTLPCD